MDKEGTQFKRHQHRGTLHTPPSRDRLKKTPKTRGRKSAKDRLALSASNCRLAATLLLPRPKRQSWTILPLLFYLTALINSEIGGRDQADGGKVCQDNPTKMMGRKPVADRLVSPASDCKSATSPLLYPYPINHAWATPPPPPRFFRPTILHIRGVAGHDNSPVVRTF